MAEPLDLAGLTVEAFARHLDEVFTATDQDAPVPLRLAEARPLGVGERAGGAFALLFLAASGPAPPQAIHALDHPRLGRLDLFLVPVGPRPGGLAYEAVFA